MSKISIPKEVWVQLYAELAGWHVEDYFFGDADSGIQDKFNHASDAFEEILGRFFEKEEL